MTDKALIERLEAEADILEGYVRNKQSREPNRDARLAAALRAAISRLRGDGPEGWQDIESAPMDGTEIIVRVIRANTPGALIAPWAQGGGEEQPRYKGWFWWTGYEFTEPAKAPTH